MTQGPFVLGSPQWLLPALLLLAVAALAVWWSYRHAGAWNRRNLLGASLKIVGVALLALCLVEPQRQGTRAIPGANLFIILADNSRSLEIADGAQSRGAQLREALQPESAWQSQLTENFGVRRFAFDSRPHTVKSFEELSFDGDHSTLVASLASIAERYRNQPVAGILLLSDGNTTEPGAGATRLAALGRTPPVYPVVLGEVGRVRDLRIENVSVSQSNFEAAPVTVRVQMAAQHLSDSTVVVDLVDRAGKVVATEEVAVGSGGPLIARLQLRPEQTGPCFYTLRAHPKREHAQRDNPEFRSSEATLENNVALVAVNRAKGPYRVLYVSGRPNWEFKFLRRALEEDAEVNLVGLVRIAKREAKFDFRRRGEERTNPLFSGFDAQEEQAEQYFEPVLVRVGADQDELPHGFPLTTDELYRYDALVLDDVEADFFTHDQMSLIHKFVSHRGGGLMVLGGQESFVEGKYDRTPLGELMPVYLDRVESQADPPAEYQLNLSKEGWLEPWVRLRDNEAEEKKRLAGMTRFHTLNVAGSIKPGAMELAHVTWAGGEKAPALVAQSFGKGRSAALLVGDFWRWGLARTDPADLDIYKAWRQTIRWLLAEAPRRLQVEVERGDNGTFEVGIEVRDEQFDALDNARVDLEVIDPSERSIALAAQSSDTQAGRYVAGFAPRDAGAYLAKVRVQAPDGSDVGSAEVGWTSQPAAEEFARVEPNRALLETIAGKTGGEVVALSDLGRLTAELPHKAAPRSEPTLTPLWHRGWLFTLAILCLCGEWGLRRWRGLP